MSICIHVSIYVCRHVCRYVYTCICMNIYTSFSSLSPESSALRLRICLARPSCHCPAARAKSLGNLIDMAFQSAGRIQSFTNKV